MLPVAMIWRQREEGNVSFLFLSLELQHYTEDIVFSIQCGISTMEKLSLQQLCKVGLDQI